MEIKTSNKMAKRGFKYFLKAIKFEDEHEKSDFIEDMKNVFEAYKIPREKIDAIIIGGEKIHV